MSPQPFRQPFRRSLGVTDKGRRLHKLYHGINSFNLDTGTNVSGCGQRLLDRLATEDEKRALVPCRAPGCAGVP